MPDKDNLQLILEIFQASKSAQVAAGVVIGLGILYFIIRWLGALFKDLRELLPAQDEKEKKKTSEVAAVDGDDKRAHEAALIAAQAAFIDDQRSLIIALTATSKRVRSLDDTIPMRDELLNKLSDESDQLGE
jgi:Na+-transporting methylmalonyl-CoA/oxaloacetate decarboxylase gamma subunit